MLRRQWYIIAGVFMIFAIIFFYFSDFYSSPPFISAKNMSIGMVDTDIGYIVRENMFNGLAYLLFILALACFISGSFGGDSR